SAGHLPADALPCLVAEGDGGDPVVVGAVEVHRVFAVAASWPRFCHVQNDAVSLLPGRERFLASHQPAPTWEIWWAQLGSNQWPLACKTQPNRRGTSPTVA